MTNTKNILVIDDDRMVHAMLKPILGAHGFVVSSAFNGEAGLAMAETGQPDLIILDVIMPTLKGREVCKRLKASPLTKDIPVLFLTAKDSDDDVAAELSAGAIGHLTKPLNSTGLIRSVKKALDV